MPAPVAKPALYLIACGAPPAADLPPFVASAVSEGWDVCVVATPDATKFLDTTQLAELTGHPVRSQYKQPDAPDILPPADAFVIAPATFNTINKLAHGISDTLALGLVNEAIGRATPVLAVPWVNAALRGHPALRTSINALRDWGVQLIWDPDPPAGAAAFPWHQLRSALQDVLNGTDSGEAAS